MSRIYKQTSGTPDNTSVFVFEKGSGNDWSTKKVSFADLKEELGTTLTTKNITDNGIYAASSDSADGYSSVTVNVPPGDKNVVFYDYDGTVLYTYTKNQFLALTEMPANPTHTGLTAQGWNWSLADAKRHVTSYDKLNIGQMYTTDDGNTRIHIHLVDRLEPTLTIGFKGTCIIYWGDGSSDTITSQVAASSISKKHTYATGGDYVISLDTTNITNFNFIAESSKGTKLITKDGTNNNAYNNVYIYSIIGINIGSNISGIQSDAFNNCQGLKFITIPNTVTSIDSNAFRNCSVLQGIILPNSIQKLTMGMFAADRSLSYISVPYGITTLFDSVFSQCASLISITLPDSITSIGKNMFFKCINLSEIILPNSITSIGESCFEECNVLKSVKLPNLIISLGNKFFYNCYTLSEVILPSSITSFGNQVFYNCNKLTSINIPINITSIKQNDFQYCYALSSIILPDTVTSLGSSCFYYCQCLSKIKLSDTLTTMDSGCLSLCSSLSSITIPNSVTTINGKVFEGCYGLKFIKFSSITPPTVSYSSAFNNIQTDCIIYVPQGSLSDYTTATNYPNPNTYTYVEY